MKLSPNLLFICRMSLPYINPLKQMWPYWSNAFLLHQLPQTVNSKSELCILLRNKVPTVNIDSYAVNFQPAFPISSSNFNVSTLCMRSYKGNYVFHFVLEYWTDGR